MNVFRNCPLKGRNTFGIEASADCLMEFDSIGELRTCLKEARKPMLTVGGGSNLLFLGDYHGTILHSQIKGFELVAEEEDSVLVKVGSGVVWDDFVEYAVSNGWWGAENLSEIPGEVGASAVQNIGAYGAEAKDIIESVEAVCVEDGSVRCFSNAECRYGYRDSIFKNELKGQYIVTSVSYRLSRKASPNLGYGSLKQSVDDMGEVSLANIRKAVRMTRDAKLPDPKVTGNAGSFFMNPVVSMSVFDGLKAAYPDMPSYPVNDDSCKVPAGWLIERCGWKGRSLGPAAVHDRQALVLVNRGGATGEDVRRLADAVIGSVREKFGIVLKAEVNYIS